MADGLVVEAAIGERRAALTDGDRAVAFHIEPDDDPDLTGAVFTARVTEAQPRSDNLFLDLGDGRRGILNARHRLGRADMAEGSRLVVQLRHSPGGDEAGKAPAVTEKIRLEGRYVSVERRADGIRAIRHPGHAVDSDTVAAEQAGLEEVLARLQPAGETGLLRPAPDLLTRLLGEIPAGTAPIIIADTDLLAAARALARRWPDLAGRIQPWTWPVPPFAALGLEDQLADALSGEIALPSGGWIALDRTRAMLAVDVNAGTAAAGRTGASPAETTNAEALAAVFEQLRLQNIGGLVAVDLLDADKAARDRLVKTARALAASDPCQIDVGGIAPFQVLLMARARRGRALADVMLGPAGHKLKPAARARALLRRAAAEARSDSRPARLILQAAPEVHAVLAARHDWLDALARQAGRAVDLRKSDIDAGDEAFMEGS